MRVLFINYELPPIGAGAGNALANIARCLAAGGTDVKVLTARYRDLPTEERRDGYTVHRVPAVRRRPDRCSPAEMLSFALGGMLPALSIGRRWKPDVACAFFGMPSGPIALLLREALGVPYLVSLRGGDVPGFMGQEMAAYHALARPVIRAVWRRSAGLIANSPGLADLARRTWPEAPLTVIPNGVDVETFCPPNRPRPASPLRLLSVGRLVKQKGMGDALAALARSKSAALLRVVGDGPERSALEAQARTLGIADRVELAGWATRAELPAHYQWADALILPSREEGMANVVLEALAAGLPAITTAIYGNRDLVAHGHNGFLTRPGDVGALAAAIDQLATEPELVRAMGHHSRQAALARRWDHVAEQYRLELAAAISAPVSSVEGAPGRPPRRLGAVDQPA